MTFAEELARLRKSVDASCADLDRRLGRTNYVARVENGSLPVPDRATAMHLGAVLASIGASVNAPTMWAMAARERDAEVTEFYETRIRDLQAGTRLAELEAENVRLRAVLARVRRALDEPSPPAE